MPITIGTAPDAWGVWFPDDPQQIPWQRFLDEVAEAGYSWIELGPFGYLPTDLSTLRSELEQRQLKVCACVVEGNLFQLGLHRLNDLHHLLNDCPGEGVK